MISVLWILKQNVVFLKSQSNMWNYITCIFFLSIGLTVIMKTSGESTPMEDNDNSSYEDLIIPRDSNNSVQFFLYTPTNPMKPCYIEPKPSLFDYCPFNTSYETKIIIHGYEIELLPGNLFQEIKNTLLEYNNYNVIVVNWTQYNQQKYEPDVFNAYIVGVDVAQMVNFITRHTGVSAESIHLIGHSLGAQIAGTAGKHVSKLGRITGLDPAGPGYSINVVFDSLRSTDAVLVDAIHSSNASHGFGTTYPMARMNFYPDGGKEHPMCQYGRNYSDGDGVEHTILTREDQGGCNHDASIHYFISSILDCEYLSTRCKDYKSYENGECKSQPQNRMGLHCKSIPGLPDHSKFYLDTSANYPFC